MKWIIEWASGRTEEINQYDRKVSREDGQFQTWPEDFLRNPQIVSAFAKPAPKVQPDLDSANAYNAQMLAAQQSMGNAAIAQQLGAGLGQIGSSNPFGLN